MWSRSYKRPLAPTLQRLQFSWKQTPVHVCGLLLPRAWWNIRVWNLLCFQRSLWIQAKNSYAFSLEMQRKFCNRRRNWFHHPQSISSQAMEMRLVIDWPSVAFFVLLGFLGCCILQLRGLVWLCSFATNWYRTNVNHFRKSGSPVNVGNTVGMLKVEAERTMENVRCQAEVENKPDKLTNYWLLLKFI